MRISYFLNLITTLFTAGAMLLQFLTILSGTKDNGILRKWYWLEVDTSTISGASPITEYTLWGFCSRDGDSLSDKGESTGCSAHKAAYGFQPDVQFEGANEVPQWFSDNHSRNYWLSRLLFPWFIIALAFETPVLFLGICSSAKRRFGVTSSLLTLVAFLFQASGAAMACVVYVQSRNHFKDAGNDAKLGAALQGFIWAATFMLAVNVFFFCCIRPHHSSGSSDKHEESAFAPQVASDNHTATEAAQDTSGGRFFGFRNSTVKQKPVGDDSSFVRAH